MTIALELTRLAQICRGLLCQWPDDREFVSEVELRSLYPGSCCTSRATAGAWVARLGPNIAQITGQIIDSRFMIYE